MSIEYTKEYFIKQVSTLTNNNEMTEQDILKMLNTATTDKLKEYIDKLEPIYNFQLKALLIGNTYSFKVYKVEELDTIHIDLIKTYSPIKFNNKLKDVAISDTIQFVPFKNDFSIIRNNDKRTMQVHSRVNNIIIDISEVDTLADSRERINLNRMCYTISNAINGEAYLKKFIFNPDQYDSMQQHFIKKSSKALSQVYNNIVGYYLIEDIVKCINSWCCIDEIIKIFYMHYNTYKNTYCSEIRTEIKNSIDNLVSYREEISKFSVTTSGYARDRMINELKAMADKLEHMIISIAEQFKAADGGIKRGTH